jgi:Putative zinc-finger
MDCRTVHDHLSTYLDRELPQQTRAMLDEHFEACHTCRTTLAQLEAVTTWVGDWPRIEPSAAFLQQVCERVERLPQPSRVGLFRRLAGTLPLQAAAALIVAVSAAVVWQVTPSLWRGQEQETAPPARVEPWSSDERRVTPVLDVPPFDPTIEEPFQVSPPLVQIPPRHPVFMAHEEFVRVAREFPAMPLLTDMPAEGKGGGIALYPSLTLRADNPVQVTQRIWELVPHTGGALLQSQGMVTPTARASRGPVRVTLSIAADRYQTLLNAIREVPGITITEERLAIIGRNLPPGETASLRLIDHSQATKTPAMPLVITILPR